MGKLFDANGNSISAIFHSDKKFKAGCVESMAGNTRDGNDEEEVVTRQAKEIYRDVCERWIEGGASY